MYDVDLVTIIPTLHHPWKPDVLTSLSHRSVMTRMLFAHLRDVGIDDTIETEIAEAKPDNEPVYTIDVIERYLRDSGNFRLIVGQDEAEGMPCWHRYDDLIRLVGQPLVVPRGCINGVSAASSTHVRELLRDGKIEEAAEFVPRSILTYIDVHRLYLPSSKT